jgi:hypothetical protein
MLPAICSERRASAAVRIARSSGELHRRIEISFIGDADHETGAPLCVSRSDLNRAREDDRIWDEDEFAGVRANSGCAYIEVSDDALIGSDDDRVTDSKRFVDEQQNVGQEVLKMGDFGLAPGRSSAGSETPGHADNG